MSSPACDLPARARQAGGRGRPAEGSSAPLEREVRRLRRNRAVKEAHERKHPTQPRRRGEREAIRHAAHAGGRRRWQIWPTSGAADKGPRCHRARGASLLSPPARRGRADHPLRAATQLDVPVGRAPGDGSRRRGSPPDGCFSSRRRRTTSSPHFALLVGRVCPALLA